MPNIGRILAWVDLPEICVSTTSPVCGNVKAKTDDIPVLDLLEEDVEGRCQQSTKGRPEP